MKGKTKIYLFFIMVIMFINIPISNSNTSGTYINNNLDEESFYAEIPYKIDTLVLWENGSYVSEFYGNGEYELESGYFTNVIELSVRKFHVENKILQPTKIILVHDLDYYYYKKID